MDLRMMIAGARLLDADEWALILEVRAERGSDAVTNAGQLALARWMLGDAAVLDTLISRIPSKEPSDYLIRVLAGEVVPNDLIANYFARISAGAISHEAWGETVELPQSFAIGAAYQNPKLEPIVAAAPATVPRHVYIAERLDVVRYEDGGVCIIGAQGANVTIPAAHIAAVQSALAVMSGAAVA